MSLTLAPFPAPFGSPLIIDIGSAASAGVPVKVERAGTSIALGNVPGLAGWGLAISMEQPNLDTGGSGVLVSRLPDGVVFLAPGDVFEYPQGFKSFWYQVVTTDPYFETPNQGSKFLAVNVLSGPVRVLPGPVTPADSNLEETHASTSVVAPAPGDVAGASVSPGGGHDYEIEAWCSADEALATVNASLIITDGVDTFSIPVSFAQGGAHVRIPRRYLDQGSVVKWAVDAATTAGKTYRFAVLARRLP